MKTNSAEIIFVVDRSGSMVGIANDMIGGFAEFVRKQKETPGECKVSLAQFDEYYEMVYEAKPLEEISTLVLEPRGGTALLDAIARTITITGERFSKTAEADRPSHVLFVIITDGQENASREVTDPNKIKEMVTHQREKYNWEFIFLGADLSAISTAVSYGISAANAAHYGANAQGVHVMFSTVAYAATSYRISDVVPNVQDLTYRISDVVPNVQDQYDAALKVDENVS